MFETSFDISILFLFVHAFLLKVLDPYVNIIKQISIKQNLKLVRTQIAAAD